MFNTDSNCTIQFIHCSHIQYKKENLWCFHGSSEWRSGLVHITAASISWPQTRHRDREEKQRPCTHGSSMAHSQPATCKSTKISLPFSVLLLFYTYVHQTCKKHHLSSFPHIASPRNTRMMGFTITAVKTGWEHRSPSGMRFIITTMKNKLWSSLVQLVVPAMTD